MYPPFNSCIYCGRADTPLSREHLIPYSLGGTDVLPRASCPECASITSDIEREVARMAYGYYRAITQSPSRKKKRQAQVLSRQVEVTGTRHDGTSVTHKVDIKDMPPYEIVFHLEEPGIICGRSPDAAVNPRSEVNIPDDNPLRKLRERLGLAKLNTPVMTFPLTSFIRTLAKIAHAYVMAELGPTKVTSELAPIVLGDLGKEFHLVGGFDPEQPQTDRALLHRIDQISGDSWLVVEISLHFFPKLPRYQVVCGKVAD